MELTVDEKTFYAVLERLRDVRKWATLTQADPWAFRQAMITVIAIDTTVALESGVEAKNLAGFDVEAGLRAEEFIKSLPEEAQG